MSKILLIDDSKTDRTFIRRILESGGHTVIEKSNAGLIMETVISEKPNLILLDIVLPEISGYEICRSLKSFKNTKNIPIIFISCKKQTSDIYWGKLQGADDYLAKPFEPSELLKLIDKYLSKS
jgi:twitching motility two-component system response regulator PilH